MSQSWIFPLKPTLVPKIWGTRELGKLKGNKDKNAYIGESWEVSVHPDGESQVEAKPLSSFLNKPLNYLVKIIDTQEHLSVQTHPDDDYAREHEDSHGKSECWVILNSKPGAGIYLGFKPGVKKDQFYKAVMEGEDISQYLVFYPTKKGDFFFVPAGTIHAIGAGVLLAEVQQSSGVTYRVWDWNRTDDQGNSRELHIDKAMDVLSFEEEKNTQEAFFSEENILEEEFYFGYSDFFNVVTYSNHYANHSLPAESRVTSILNFENAAKIIRKQTKEEFLLKPYSSYLLNLNKEEEIELSSIDSSTGKINGIIIY